MITFLTDLLNINPAYNDSIIRYQSDQSGMTKSDIVINALPPLSVYSYGGIFQYNLKDIVKTEINKNGFKDSIIPNISSGNYIYSDPSLQLKINAEISVYGTITGESITTNYTFIKSAEQLIGYNRKLQSGNNIRLLLPTKNNFDYQVTYFEGYPFDFAVYGIQSGDTYYFKNSNIGMSSDVYTSEDSEVKRIYLSDGGTNITLGDILIMSSTLNRIELWVNDQLKSNISINRIESDCGVYLKWFNQSGSYSYWRFDQFYNETFKTKDLDVINGKWDNLQNISSTSESLGKTCEQTIQLNTTFNNWDKEYLSDLALSPHVEMYIHQTPFNQIQEFDFIGVKVSDGSFPFGNKNSKNKFKITLEMPSINTVTY